MTMFSCLIAAVVAALFIIYMRATSPPEQLSLPFHCSHHGEACKYRPSRTAFYGSCVTCGSDYDPVCDR